MSDQLELILVDDYREDWEPSRYSCYDCALVVHPKPWDWHIPSRCSYLGREIERVAGICGKWRARP